jgi:hypothetical protein
MARPDVELPLMVPVREDWARRSAAGLDKGPYPVETLGLLEYATEYLFVYVINEHLAGK